MSSGDKRAQVDDFGIDALLAAHRLGDMDHRAVGEHRHACPSRTIARLAERDGVVALRHLASGCSFHGLAGLVVIAVERAVVDALGLEEDHRIVVLDRRDQQALGIVRRCDGTTVFMPDDVGEERLGALAVRLPAEDAAAERLRTVIGAMNSPAER